MDLIQHYSKYCDFLIGIQKYIFKINYWILKYLYHLQNTIIFATLGIESST